MRALLVLAGVLLPTLLVVTQAPAWADPGLTVSVSPSAVGVGLNFTGEDVRIYGAAPEGTELIVKVDGPATSAKVSKKGKVLGLFWMTVDQAEVENMPAYHLVRSSSELEEILSWDEQVRLGVDPMSASIMSQALVVDTGGGNALPADKAAEFIAGLRDTYIRDGRYTPCVSCHSAAPVAGSEPVVATDPGDHAIHLENGQWETWVSLPWDTPLGDYTVDCYSVKDGQVVASGSASFAVTKAGLVKSLGSFASDNGAAYGAMALGIIIVVGMTIGLVFSKRRASH